MNGHLQKKNEKPTAIFSNELRMQRLHARSGDDAQPPIYKALNMQSGTTKRVTDEFFSKDGRILVPHTHLQLPLGNISEENDYIRVNCERGHWCRTRYDKWVVYLFENAVDAMAMKMMFG